MNKKQNDKQVYEEPKLIVHGNMAQLVATNQICNFQDLLGVPPSIVGSEFAPATCA